MTLGVVRDGQKIKITGNVGVDVSVQNSQLSSVTINEDAQHVEWFHTQLGNLLAEAKAERDAT